jgi:two-component system, response regulator PdtaR
MSGCNPVRVLAVRSQPPHIASSPDETAAPAAKGKHEAPSVLVVEDDFLVAMQVENALSDAGLEVIGTAGSADGAIKRVAAQCPTLVVMDVRLSGSRDGIETALELFSKYGIRCLFATAHHTADAHARAEPARPLGWLPKPYTMPALVEAVQNALQDLSTK